MTFFWINIEIINANFNNLTLEEKQKILFSLDDIRKKLNCDKILFSINSSASISDAQIFLAELDSLCKSCGLEFEIGPQFIEEGCLYKEKLSGFIELFFRNRVDKISIFLKKHPEYNIGAMLFIDTQIDYEPIIIAKVFANKIPILFAHQNPDLANFYNKKVQDSFYEVKSGQFLLSAIDGINKKIKDIQKLELKK